MSVEQGKSRRRQEILSSLRTRRVGLVLGGGGATGMAFHAGTLLALNTDFGWDPRSASVMVGTSAGSVMAALLRAGFDVDDLAAWNASAPARVGREEVLTALAAAEAQRPRFVRPTWSRPGGGFTFSTRPNRRMLLSALPNGVVDAKKTLGGIGELCGGWPAEPLWITAVRRTDSRRVVFGKDRTCPLGTAIAASCAIPGLFTPIDVDGQAFVDGGYHSPTNADLLVDAGVDVAVVLSPMSIRPSSARRRVDDMVRLGHRAQLERECRRLRSRGIEVVMFEPEAQTVAAMGPNALNSARRRRVLRAAYLGTTAPSSRNAQLASPRN